MQPIYTKTVEIKVNGKYDKTYTETNERDIYTSLANDLIARYVTKARYVKRVIRKPRYDGTDEITVYYENGIRSIYIVAT